MDNVICKAEIKKTKNKYLLIYEIIAIIILLIGSGKREYYERTYYGYLWKVAYNNVFFSSTDRDDGSVFEHYEEGSIFIAFLVIIFAIVVIPKIINVVINKIIDGCSLTLTEKGINGQRKKMLSTANLQLPIDKIDNIMITENMFNKLFGGQTIAISSASGTAKFPWVQNADEFLNATLAKIEEYKQQMKEDNKTLIAAAANNSANAANSSAATKIKELKELLDSGIITQEDFEAKKQELLSKM